MLHSHKLLYQFFVEGFYHNENAIHGYSLEIATEQICNHLPAVYIIHKENDILGCVTLEASQIVNDNSHIVYDMQFPKSTR